MSINDEAEVAGCSAFGLKVFARRGLHFFVRAGASNMQNEKVRSPKLLALAGAAVAAAAAALGAVAATVATSATATAIAIAAGAAAPAPGAAAICS